MLTRSQRKRAEVPIKTPLCWDYPVNAFLWLCQQCCGGFVWRIPLGPGGRQRVLCSPWGRARHHPDTWRWHSSAGPPAGLSPGASLQLPGCCKGFPEITPFTSPLKCRCVQMRMQRKKLGSSGPEAKWGQACDAEQGAERGCPPAAPLTPRAPSSALEQLLGLQEVSGQGDSCRASPRCTEPLLLGPLSVGVGLLSNAEGAVFVLGSTQGFPTSS